MQDSYSALAPAGRKWHLRWRLSLVLVALFIAIFALSAVSHFQKLDDQQDARVQSMQQVEQTINAALDGFVGDLESFALSTAITLGDSGLPIEYDNLTPESEAAVNNYLKHLFDSFGILRAIFITEPDGTVVYSDGGGSAGRSLAERGYIAALQQGAESVWSEGIPGLESGQTIVTHARRIVSPTGETTGFLAIAFYPDALAQRLPPGIAGDGHISVIDQNGLLLLQLPQPNGTAPPETITAWPELDAARNGEEVVLRAEDVPLNPGDRYVALGGLQGVDWVVGYSLPPSAIEGEAGTIFQRDLILLAGLMVGGLMVTLYLAHRVSDPLMRMGRVAPRPTCPASSWPCST
jgi:hypothetical protein